MDVFAVVSVDGLELRDLNPANNAVLIRAAAPLYSPGDVNGDRRVDLQDVLLMYQHFRGKITGFSFER